MAVVIALWAPQAIATLTMPGAESMTPVRVYEFVSDRIGRFGEAIRSRYSGRGVAFGWGVEVGRSGQPHVNVALRRQIESRSVRRGDRTERRAALGWPDTDSGLPFRIGTVRMFAHDAGFGWSGMEAVRHHLFGPAYLLKMPLFGATVVEERRPVLDAMYLGLNGGLIFNGELPEDMPVGARFEADRDRVLGWIATKNPRNYLPPRLIDVLWPELPGAGS